MIKQIFCKHNMVVDVKVSRRAFHTSFTRVGTCSKCGKVVENYHG